MVAKLIMLLKSYWVCNKCFGSHPIIILSEGCLRLGFGGLIIGSAHFFLGGGGYYRNFTVYTQKPF